VSADFLRRIAALEKLVSQQAREIAELRAKLAEPKRPALTVPRKTMSDQQKQAP
jgi:uncharacterized coiled-coil protein SlyX